MKQDGTARPPATGDDAKLYSREKSRGKSTPSRWIANARQQATCRAAGFGWLPLMRMIVILNLRFGKTFDASGFFMSCRSDSIKVEASDQADPHKQLSTPGFHREASGD